jgi:hypothetical protein
MDGNRELRAMILCTLPYPPLPVTAKRFEDNKLGDTAVISSHDIISNLLEAACVKNKTGENSDRLGRQQAIMQDLLRELQDTQEPEKLYNIYCRQTAAHISSYYPVGAAPELRFMPIDYCCRGDTVHTHLCQYMAAQSIWMQDTKERKWNQIDLPALLVLTRERWVHQGQESLELLGGTCQASLELSAGISSCDEISPNKERPDSARVEELADCIQPTPSPSE